jgi:hypothetical protein
LFFTYVLTNTEAVAIAIAIVIAIAVQCVVARHFD